MATTLLVERAGNGGNGKDKGSAQKRNRRDGSQAFVRSSCPAARCYLRLSRQIGRGGVRVHGHGGITFLNTDRQATCMLAMNRSFGANTASYEPIVRQKRLIGAGKPRFSSKRNGRRPQPTPANRRDNRLRQRGRRPASGPCPIFFSTTAMGNASWPAFRAVLDDSGLFLAGGSRPFRTASCPVRSASLRSMLGLPRPHGSLIIVFRSRI